jgi:predicted nicotinamide N-methyase
VILRPPDPEALIDEARFAVDEFMPYWAELWPSGVGLADALPDDLVGLTVVELGCGLGVPSLVAAARGARVTAVDWAGDAIDLLRRNALGNHLELDAVRAEWSSFEGSFDLVLGADLLYEERNGRALLEVLPSLAPRVLLAEPGRATAAAFFEDARDAWEIAEAGERVYELRRATRGDPPAHGHG